MKVPPDNYTQDIKLYSLKAINGATFLGGPLAAGFLIGENFKALGQKRQGRSALIIGILATLIIFIGLFSAPDEVVDRIPRPLLPAIYTLIVWLLVEWKQGDALKAHKTNNNSFYSGWRAAGIGLISFALLGIGIIGYVLLSPENQLLDQYDAKIAQFTKNENETLVFYDHLSTDSDNSLLRELNEVVIPTWKENILLIKSTNELGQLPSDLERQNEILIRYCELRIEAFELYYRSILEKTNKYSIELDLIHAEIEKELDKL